MNEKILYIDLDGVLADFNSYYSQKYESFEYSQFQDEVLNHNLFVKLSPIPGALQMVQEIEKLVDNEYKIEILSSVHSLNQNHIDIATQQKQEWLKKYNLDKYPLNVVNRRSEKGKYANPSTILIDDQLKCVQYFIEMGGKAVCFQTCEKTIKDLKLLLQGYDIEHPTELSGQF